MDDDKTIIDLSATTSPEPQQPTPAKRTDAIEEEMLVHLDAKPTADDDQPIIKIIGVGGGGCNAVNNMFAQNVKGVKFAVCNTDKKQLEDSPVPEHVQLGAGLGAGTNAEKGREEAEKDIEKIRTMFDPGTHMVFITAGMGGGTGTGAAPVIAREAHDRDLLTVGIVTIPFKLEGRPKILQALAGVQEISKHVDALLVINNERIKEIYGDLPLTEAFKRTDNTLTVAASSIAEIITMHGIMNLDFEDVRTVMKGGGVAIMSTGRGEGEGRVKKAIEQALYSPLLNNNDVHNSRKVLIHIVGPTEGNPDALMMEELNEIDEFMSHFRNDVLTKWGYSTDPELEKEVRITILATGFGIEAVPGVKEHRQEEDQAQEDAIITYYGETNRDGKMRNTYRIYTYDLDDLDNDDIIADVELTPTAQRTKQELHDIREKRTPKPVVEIETKPIDENVIQF